MSSAHQVISQQRKQRTRAASDAAVREVLRAAGESVAAAPAAVADAARPEAGLADIARLGPLRLNTLVHCGWINSVVGGRPISAHGAPLPWFTYPAIDFLEPRIRSNCSVLEWGCGNSTLWWAQRARQVVAVEHNPDWLARIAATAPANVRLHLAEDMQQYVGVSAVDGAGPFDVIVIDGEMRNECAARASELANPSGLIVFDNSDRKAYRQGMELLAAKGWKRIDFFGLIPSYCYRICTSIFFRDDAILGAGPLPCDAQSSLGLTCAQVLGE